MVINGDFYGDFYGDFMVMCGDLIVNYVNSG